MNLKPKFNWKESKINMQVAINNSYVTQTLKQSIFTFQKNKNEEISVNNQFFNRNGFL
jgi:hypothetical protein